MDATAELRDAHDKLAEFYVERLGGALEAMPVDRAVLGLFCELTVASGLGTDVGDIGSGTGRLAPWLASRGLRPHGVDLSPEMVRVARRDHPGHDFQEGDLRALPFADGQLAGVVCWYSLLFLAPEDRGRAFAELARVVRPGGYLVAGYKAGDGTHQRRGRPLGLGIEFDAYWLSPEQMEDLAAGAGFATVFWAGRPAEEGEGSPQGFLISRRTR